MKIDKLQIFTSRLEEQRAFYRDVLKLVIDHSDANCFEVTLGYSQLRFEHKEGATPYHIAFHIPDNQEKKALEWLKQKVDILMYNEDEIIDFSNWNAKSIYFYDLDKNILEFISRKDSNPVQSMHFNAGSITGIAEVGLATITVGEIFSFLHRECALEIFDGNLQKFCAIGDSRGLIITIDKELKDWFPVDDKAYSSGFSIEFSHKGNTYRLIYHNNTLSHNH